MWHHLLNDGDIISLMIVTSFTYNYVTFQMWTSFPTWNLEFNTVIKKSIQVNINISIKFKLYTYKYSIHLCQYKLSIIIHTLTGVMFATNINYLSVNDRPSLMNFCKDKLKGLSRTHFRLIEALDVMMLLALISNVF